MTNSDGDRALVTGHLSHQIYVQEGNTKRWVPDLWTMQAEGLSPADLQVLSEDELEALEEKDPIPSQVPPPRLSNGQYIETEVGVYKFEGGELVRILDPRSSNISEEARAAAIFLPESVVRGFPVTGRLT
ncbi:hypothetical protein [Blastococcus mobilis]|uniref:Uncharacterized protein n=1 Tax=Blastococcus mobilis TaxID=1938746 RepID=A0A239AZE6_9ACTN|nr:hypothetical protein [Blastococcus mobilis]SNS00358.1 hypothetical protein SAMN06272737_1642 [Blastococcus mobilis]